MSHFTINRVVLIGRLTRDPELRALPSGTSVCGLRIACNSSRRDADGEFVERPNFFDVSVYGAAGGDGQPLHAQGQPRRASTGAWSGASGRPASSRGARR